jgi:hypothetical protein
MTAPTETPATISRAEYNLCDLENSNLRKCLAWAGARLSIEDRLTLASMIRGPITTKGGIVEDGREEDRRDLIECEKLLRRMTDHVQSAIDTKTLLPGWWLDADNLCNRAREWEPKLQEPTLHEVRQLYMAIDAEGRAKVTPRNKVDSTGTPLRRNGGSS